MYATTLSSMAYMLMVHMSRFTVWTSENTGEFINAERMVVDRDTVSFMVGEKVVKSYPTKQYIKYNKEPKPVETN